MRKLNHVKSILVGLYESKLFLLGEEEFSFTWEPSLTIIKGARKPMESDLKICRAQILSLWCFI